MSSSSTQEMMKSKNFSQTCDLLSQYMKGNKGSFGSPAMNLSSLASAMGTSSPAYSNEVKSMRLLFPRQHASLGAVPNTMETNNKSESAQMTIFYGGKIMVLDNLSEDSAKQLLGFAENFSGSYIANTRETSSNNFVAVNNNLILRDLLPPRNQRQQPAIASGSSSLYINASDVPAAKNTSLQRFLAKRKERINARAPYQLKASSWTTKETQAEGNKETDESKTWLGLRTKSTTPQMES
ncbi:hypothetical protein MKX01_028245 [Papaver californicum]|nr:hypothetical protein MKX01_028245 [Papaver californicum]